MLDHSSHSGAIVDMDANVWCSRHGNLRESLCMGGLSSFIFYSERHPIGAFLLSKAISHSTGSCRSPQVTCYIHLIRIAFISGGRNVKGSNFARYLGC